ncbi:MAG: ATP-dependent DNA ligase [Micropruina sp.]
MALPLTTSLQPMLCKTATSIPAGMAYEPKWDGFRCLVFRDGDDVQLISRNGRDLTPYFPDVEAAVLDNTPPRCILDGELICVQGDRLDFVTLSERIHPAASRIAMLAEKTPASLVCWDLLAVDDTDLTGEPFSSRRARLEVALQHSEAPVHLTPLTTDPTLAEQWFQQFEGAGLDGVVAKPLDGPYLPGQRAMIKIKHRREADVVVGGFKLHKNSTAERPLLGSLQLGLFDATGDFHWIGVSAAFPDATRAALAELLAETTVPSDSDEYDQLAWSQPQVPGGARRPGSISRWGGDATKVFHLIDPQLVCTIGYDHFEGTRLRHTARFLRWRPDRDPASCTFDQLDEVVGFDLAAVLPS